MPENFEEQLRTIVEKIPEISENRNYWLIRTEAGAYYQSFREHNYVAIGHNNIRLFEINDIRTRAEGDMYQILAGLKELAAERYPDESRPGLIGSQVYRFIFEVKRGDIVVIPSERSESITIGEVQNSVALNTTNAETERTQCPFMLRKEVRWEKDLQREGLDPNFYMVLQAHQAINNINEYGDIIERAFRSFFIKEGQGNLILDVRRRRGINAFEMFQFGFFLLNFTNDFLREYGIDLNAKNTEIQVNLNSPGKFHFKGDKKTIFLIGLIGLFIIGGGLERGDFKASTDGIIKGIIDYQNNKYKREAVERIMESADSLNIQTAEDVVVLLNAIDND